jgi:hypothetical protein
MCPRVLENQEGDWLQDTIRPFTSLIDHIIDYSVSLPFFMYTHTYEDHSESHLAISTARKEAEVIVMVVMKIMIARALSLLSL